jgi:hypothetical protein
MKNLCASFCVILSVASAARSKRRSKMHGILDELPNTGREWVTLDNGVEFQPGSDINVNPRMEQQQQQQYDRKMSWNYTTHSYNKNSSNSNSSSSSSGHTGKKWTADYNFQSSNPFENIFIDGIETYYDEYSQAWRYLGFYIDCDAVVEDGDGEDRKNRGRGLSGDDEDRSGCMRYLLWAAVSNNIFIIWRQTVKYQVRTSHYFLFPLF